MARPKKKPTQGNPSDEVQLEWQIPDNVITHRVTNAVVQMKGAEEFVISFFEERGPLLITEEDRAKAMKSKSARALCVARICITPERMGSFAKVFEQQYKLYEEFRRSIK